MAIRRQIREFVLKDDGATSASDLDEFKEKKRSIFVSEYGNADLTKSQNVNPNSFITVEAFGSTPGFGVEGGASWEPRGFFNIRIENTFFFVNPDGTSNEGLSGTGAPYPITVQNQRSYNQFPRVYIQGGQTFDFTYYMGNTMVGTADDFSGSGAFSMTASG